MQTGLAHQLRRPGLRLPRHRATTAHAQALYPWHVDSGLGSRGVYIGEDITGGNGAWCFDPFQLYTDKVLSSPNILVLGVVGSGKSSAVKTYLYRSIGILGSGGEERAPRWTGILDPKGEYGPLASALGLTRLELYPGGPDEAEPARPWSLYRVGRGSENAASADDRGVSCSAAASGSIANRGCSRWLGRGGTHPRCSWSPDPARRRQALGRAHRIDDQPVSRDQCASPHTTAVGSAVRFVKTPERPVDGNVRWTNDRQGSTGKDGEWWSTSNTSTPTTSC